ncbi:unnamed protein product [Amoebophrya sp. A25]|nr:unnamed protein product [Amoebophrya sp. A25]|eukprot:GSA25T00020400001.1
MNQGYYVDLAAAHIRRAILSQHNDASGARGAAAEVEQEEQPQLLEDESTPVPPLKKSRSVAGRTSSGINDIDNLDFTNDGALLKWMLSSSSSTPGTATSKTTQDLRKTLYRFKRYEKLLPRVQAVIGVVKSQYVTSILDVASQRGALLFPLIASTDIQSSVERVVSIDIEPAIIQFLKTIESSTTCRNLAFEARLADFTDLRRDLDLDLPSALSNLNHVELDEARIAHAGGRVQNRNAEIFADEAFECVICSEILEHLTSDGIRKAAREALRVTSRIVVCTVPAQPDSNPEHVQLFYHKKPHDMSKITRRVQENQEDLEKLWLDAGASSVKIQFVQDAAISVLLAVIQK